MIFYWLSSMSRRRFGSQLAALFLSKVMAWLFSAFSREKRQDRGGEACESDTSSGVCAESTSNTSWEVSMLDSREAPMPPEDALLLLQDGNARFVKGTPMAVRTNDAARCNKVDLEQPPHAAIVGCSDCCALETIFDSLPGDIYAFKNAGNTLTHASGSMVASLEFCVDLGCRLILVLGHSPCIALEDATKAYFQRHSCGDSALNNLLYDLGEAVQETIADTSADAAEVALRAVPGLCEVNVFHTADLLLKFSRAIREKVSGGELQVQGAVFDSKTGKVEFLGRSPREAEILKSDAPAPVWPDAVDDEMPAPECQSLRLAPEEALSRLRDGNLRFVDGAVWQQDLCPAAQHHCAVLACADARVPVDVIFNAAPGEIFVMKNAGNTCTHSAGSIMSSLEFSVTKLGVRLVLILGHTPCTAMTVCCKQAHAAHDEDVELEQPLMQSLSAAASQAEHELGEGSSPEEISKHAVKLNVFHVIESIFATSQILRSLAKNSTLQVQGGLYHMETGNVEFLGRLPHEEQVLE
ncbi:unnamed protein product [Effrenium voratum]|nr:unnamed protein product [Effrenium voratum]